jgi:riboflavin synthase
MFTGLVEGTGKVTGVDHVRGEILLTILPAFEMADTGIGDSISVDGVCLTATGIHKDVFSVDVSGETISRTTLGQLRRGRVVNLERALRLGDRLGGHFVSGHVDGIGVILSSEPFQRSQRIRVGISEGMARYTIEKGSVAVDGISLTINHCDQASFEVNIISQTAQETTILKKRAGDKVNIETDLIGKYVERLLMFRKDGGKAPKDSVIDYEMLIKQGFGK